MTDGQGQSDIPPQPRNEAAELAERTLTSARDRLAALDDVPTTEHVAVFEELHRELSTVLGSLDQAEQDGGAGPGGPTRPENGRPGN